MISNTTLIIILFVFGFIMVIVFLRILFTKQEIMITHRLRRRRRNMVYPEQIIMQPNIMQPEETIPQPETNTNTPIKITPYEMV